MLHFLASTVVVGNSGDFIHNAFVILIFIICAGIVWALGRWAFAKLQFPAIVLTIWSGFFVLIGAIMVINFLMSLTGHGFIAL